MTKKPLTRNLKGSKNARNISVAFKVSENELKAIEENAKRNAGGNRSVWIRTAAIFYTTRALRKII